MADVSKVQITEREDILDILSGRWSISRANLLQVVKSTVFRGDAAKASNEDLVMFLSVCAKYDLNPFLREIHVFLGKGGGIFPIVGVDGWVTLRNREKRFNGVEFADLLDKEGNIVATTCRIHVKGLERSIEVTEYMKECARDTEPWKKWPARMLRHKAHIQCIRSAFGYGGIFDEDEADRIGELDVTPALPEAPLSVRQAAEVAEAPKDEAPAPAKEPFDPDLFPRTPMPEAKATR